MSTNRVRVAVGKVAAASRKAGKVPDGALEEARNELVAARLEEAIDLALDPAEPYAPISEKDRQRLAEKLLGRLADQVDDTDRVKVEELTDKLHEQNREYVKMRDRAKAAEELAATRDTAAEEWRARAIAAETKIQSRPQPRRGGANRGRPTGPGGR